MAIKGRLSCYWGFLSLVAIFCCFISCRDNSQNQNETSILFFSIQGTSPISNGVVPINANDNNGKFEVQWNVASSDPYNVKLFVSQDPNLSKNSDIEFLNQNCGSDGSYNCDGIGEFYCSFNTAKIISCAGGVSGVNLSPILDQSPKVAYIILEACNGYQTECKTRSQEVIFQN